MRLATFLRDGFVAVGLVDKDGASVLQLQKLHREIHGADHPQLASMLDVISHGDAALEAIQSLAEHPGARTFALGIGNVRLLAPVPVPPQIRDFSFYEQHLRDAPTGMKRLKARLSGDNAHIAPVQGRAADVYYERPIYYISNRFNVVGTDTDVEWPEYCDFLDYELEVGAFISRKVKNVSADAAGRCIFGYTIFNDFSARDRQSREMEGFMGPAKGKSFDTGNAIGPWIVTRDEIDRIDGLRAQVSVDGELWGSSSTENMMHSFEESLAYVSRSETVYPGEFFGSGTIGGCCGLEIDRWLRPGSTVELTVEKLGTLRNRVVRA